MADDLQKGDRRGHLPIGASPGRLSPILTRRRARQLAEKEVAAAEALSAVTTMMVKETPSSIRANVVAAPDAAAAAAPALPTAREVAAAEAARQRLYVCNNAEAAPSSSMVVLPSGTPPPAVVDVPLRPTSELEPFCQGGGGESGSGNVSSLLACAVSSLGSERKWDDVARGLDTLRRGVKHHREEALSVLPAALPGIAAAVGSLRSALCRAGLAAATDIAAAFGADEPWVFVGKESGDGEGEEERQGLLSCLLSKAASNDKKFIVDAAAAALSVASAEIPARLLALRLLDLLAAKPSLPPRGRAAVARALAEVIRSSSSSWISDDQPLLLCSRLSAVASELSRDAWPPARQAARDLAAALPGAFAWSIPTSFLGAGGTGTRVGKVAAQVEEKGVVQPPAPATFAAVPQSEQGKENAAAPAVVVPGAPFSAAGKVMNVVEAPAAAAPQHPLPPQQMLGERGE